MASRTTKIAIGATSIASVALALVATSDQATAQIQRPYLGFTPITTNALPCSASGYARFANDPYGGAIIPGVLMSANDPATPLNAPATSTKVGRENDMIALSPDGKYLYTVSENSIPTESTPPDGSDGVTRLTLTGASAGKKEILADDTAANGSNIWQRVDGIKWYPHGGPNNLGVLLISEEFATGKIWQVDPKSGNFARLDWMGSFAHEGIGLDAYGAMYLGDENRAGAIYKAVPTNPNNLTQGGKLYYLVGTGTNASGWKLVSNPANATAEALAGGAVLFDRPEDFDQRNSRVYFAVTEPQADAAVRTASVGRTVNGGGVYSISTTGVPDLATQSGSLPYNLLTPMIPVNDPKYTTASDAQAQQGLQFPDNLAFDGKGHLWVHEDIPDGSTFPVSGIDVGKQVRNQQDELYVYVLAPGGKAIAPNASTSGPAVSGGYKAADMRTSPLATPCQNEFTGGVFAFDGRTLYINQQHADSVTLRVRTR